jgi:hypothetical protein
MLPIDSTPVVVVEKLVRIRLNMDKMLKNKL